MRYLVHSGYTTLHANEFAAFIEGKAGLPQKSVLITFDDGYLDNYVYAFPVLKRLGLHVVIFAVTGWIGEGPTRPHAGMGKSEILPECLDQRAGEKAITEGYADALMLRWSEIKAMEASGVAEIHCHTHSHTRWYRQYPDTRVRVARLEEDLVRSRAALREHLGRDSGHLCWPHGYYEAGFVEAAEEAGFSVLYSVRPGVCTPRTNPACVPRIEIKDVDAHSFARRLWIYSRPWINPVIRVRDKRFYRHLFRG
jgi:peptidoglycan/xylan/chitin deacetylase (PgdA/CDA1 family)